MDLKAMKDPRNQRISDTIYRTVADLHASGVIYADHGEHEAIGEGLVVATEGLRATPTKESLVRIEVRNEMLRQRRTGTLMDGFQAHKVIADAVIEEMRR